MSVVSVASSESLLAMESTLGSASERIRDVLPDIRSRVGQLRELLDARQAECRRQMAYWRMRIENAGEDEDTRPYYEQLEIWSAHLEKVRSWQSEVEQRTDAFRAHANRLEMLSNDRAQRARGFLRQRAEEIEAYASLRPDSSGGGGAGGAGMAVIGSSPSGSVNEWGYIPSEDDPRDWLWVDLYGPPPSNLSQRSNLESLVGPAYDQGRTPQCVCYSLAALKHLDEARNGQWLTFDASSHYAMCKARSGQSQDGLTIREALKAAAKSGMASDDGSRYHVRGYARLQSVGEIQHALSLGKAVMLGLQIDNAALSALGPDALAGPPKTTDGGHCMLAVGYDDTLCALRIRNSWGSGWGDHGHYWLPYHLLASGPRYEAWTTVDEKVPADSPPESERIDLPAREVSSTNFAWFHPGDVSLSGDDGPGLEWSRLSREVADDLLGRIVGMRPYIRLDDLRESALSGERDRLAALTDERGRRRFEGADLTAFDLFFRGDRIRIDVDGQGGYSVVNGRHRLYAAQQLGLKSVPVSISNMARRQLREQIGQGGGQ